MYELVKFISLWVYPLGSVVLLGLVGLALLMLRWRRAGVIVLGAGVVWLWLWSMPAVADSITALLEREWEYRPAESLPQADAIVILGGAFSSGLGEWPVPDAGDNIDRYWYGARLYHAGRAPVVILSGGRNPKRPESWSEAESGAIFLNDMGVPESALILDSEAQTTRENVVYVGEILQDRGLHSFLLVTSARHMRRSIAAFRHEGFEPMPAPTDFLVVENPAFSVKRFMPHASALARSTAAVHEFVGYFFYRFMGWG